MIDIPALYYVPLNFRWVSKREVFKTPFFGQYLVLHGDICIDRSRAAEALEQMVRDGRMWISRGASVAVFPEGTRSKNGEIGRFKAGAFTLAKEAGVDILPVVMDGTKTLIRKNLAFNWGNRITLRVLPPVPASEVAATETHELMQTVRERMCEAFDRDPKITNYGRFTQYQRRQLRRRRHRDPLRGSISGCARACTSARWATVPQPDEALYVLIKEVVDNSIDEFIMGAGKQIDITIADKVVTVRDYGRGIPLKSLSVAVGQMNTGGKYGSDAFKKTVGMNGVGVKAVNMLSSEFTARSVRDGEARTVTFSKGLEVSDKWESGVHEKNGTFISYRVDEEIFGEYAYNLEYVEQKIRNYSYLNLGLTLNFNGKSYVSRNGLLDLVNDNLTEEPLYPRSTLTGDDIEVVITHGTGYGESYDSFVNGQHTIHGGTHQVALLRAAVAKTVKEFYHKDYDRRTSVRRSWRPSRSRFSIRCSRTSRRPSSDRARSSRGCRSMRSWATFWRSTSTTTCTSTPRRRRFSRRRSSRTRRSARRSRASRRRPARRPRK